MKNRSKAFLWVLGVFLLGAVGGFAGALLMERSPNASPNEDRHRSEWRTISKKEGTLFKSLIDKLEPDAAQEKDLRQILEKNRNTYNQEIHESRKKLMAMRREMLTEIRAILRPDQIEKLDELLRSWEEKHRRDKRDHKDRSGEN